MTGIIVYNLIPDSAENYTPSANEIPKGCVGFHVGSAGTVTLVTKKDETVDMVCVAGQQVALRIKKITAFTGTAGTLTIFKSM
jgi:hypothetical protein